MVGEEEVEEGVEEEELEEGLEEGLEDMEAEQVPVGQGQATQEERNLQ